MGPEGAMCGASAQNLSLLPWEMKFHVAPKMGGAAPVEPHGWSFMRTSVSGDDLAALQSASSASSGCASATGPTDAVHPRHDTTPA